MYAIIKTGGKQYRVQPGDVLKVEKLDAEAGSKVKIETVLAVSDDKELKVGTPFLDAAVVDANVLSAGKSEKVIIFKFKSKKDYRKKQGHRQPYTEIEIESISLGGKIVAKMEEKLAVADDAEATEAEAVTDENEAKDVAETKDEAVNAEAEAEAVTETKDELAGAEPETADVVAEKPKTARKPATKKVDAANVDAAEATVGEEEKPKTARKPAAKKADADNGDAVAEEKPKAKKAAKATAEGDEDADEKPKAARKPAVKKTETEAEAVTETASETNEDQTEA